MFSHAESRVCLDSISVSVGRMNNTTDQECFQEYNENVYQVSDDEEYTR